ncbi:MAG: hypothetical protein MZV70_08065 [Desulfobacterales bacterium]|nr:hypothetical protein [Desulfobacterales bacterium]
MSRHTLKGVALGAAILLAGCDGLLDVTNPGPINDADLNTTVAMPALVVGMSADLSAALSTTAIWGSLWGDDYYHSGTLGAPHDLRPGHHRTHRHRPVVGRCPAGPLGGRERHRADEESAGHGLRGLRPDPARLPARGVRQPHPRRERVQRGLRRRARGGLQGGLHPRGAALHGGADGSPRR